MPYTNYMIVAMIDYMYTCMCPSHYLPVLYCVPGVGTVAVTTLSLPLPLRVVPYRYPPPPYRYH